MPAKEDQLKSLRSLDQKRDVLFHLHFGSILECIQQTISCEQKRAKALHSCVYSVLENLVPREEEEESAKILFPLKTGDYSDILLPTVRRLAFKCPFSEVRELMQDYLKRHENDNPASSQASSFVPSNLLVPVSPKDEVVRQMFEDIFASRGRLSHIDQVLGWHPLYLEAFTMTTEFLMREEGELSVPIRNYLAIIASSLHNCQYLVSLQESEFTFNRGEPSWLEGLDKAPQKIQRLLKLGKLLAHRPWKLTPEDIGGQMEGSNGWTVAELVQIIAIFATFFSLTGLVHGMGLLPEIDMENPTRSTLISKDYKLDDQTRETVQKNRENLLKLLDTKEKRPQIVEKKKLAAQKASSVDICCLTNLTDTSSKYPEFTGKDVERYVDFNIKTEKLHRRQDYDWRSHGYGLMSRYYQGFAPMLNSEFDLIYNLTYQRLTSAGNVDTGPFRRAVWYYVHRLYGIENDDYDYASINKYLNKQVKKFIKKCACYPQDITRSDYEVFGYDFTDDEKCHVTLLVFEARRQASIVFGLKALGKYLSSTR